MGESHMFDGLNCLKCGEVDSVTLHLTNETFGCTSCDAELSLDDVDAMLQQWALVLKWVKLGNAKGGAS